MSERKIKVNAALAERIGVNPDDELLLLATLVDGRYSAAITTRERYQNFEWSLAHLYANGAVKCYGTKVGTALDIEDLGKVAA